MADTLPRQQAILGSSVANLLVAALATGDWATASQMMERDQFHENARTKLVPELPVIREAAHQLGIFGPTLVALVQRLLPLALKRNSLFYGRN